MEDNADSEIYSNELKNQAGFGTDGEKGFDGAITNLMMQTYLCNCDFKKRVNKRGIESVSYTHLDVYKRQWGISSVIFLYLFLRGKWVYGFEKS